MNGRSYWQLDPDLRNILPRAWKAWELYREDLATFSGFAMGGQSLAEGDLEVVLEDAQGSAAERPQMAPELRAYLKGLSPLVRAPFEGRGWPYFFTAAYLLANPGWNYLLGGTAGTVLLLSKYAPELGSLRALLQGGGAWAVQWLGLPGRGQAHPQDQVWRITGRHDYAPGIGLADYVLLGGGYGGEDRPLFLLPRRNHRGRLNYRTETKPGVPGLPWGVAHLEESEAYLLGKIEEGGPYRSEMLAVDNLTQAMSRAGEGRHLQLGAALLPEMGPGAAPALRHAMTDWAVRLAGTLALNLRAVATWDKTRQEYPPYENAFLAQFLAKLARLRATEHAAAVARGVQEVLGGVGIAQSPALAGLVAEAQNVPLWQSPAHTEVPDLMDLLTRRRVAAPFHADFVGRLQAARQNEASIAAEILSQTLDSLHKLNPAEALWHGPDWVRRLADSAAAALLYDLAATGGDRYAKLAELYARRFVRGEPYPAWAMNESRLWGVAPQTSSS